MTKTTIDLGSHPNHAYRIDSFSIPDTARSEFEAAMRRVAAFLQTIPGFRGHVAFEKASGPTKFDITTIAVWESHEALEKAGAEVRAYHASIGVDLPARLAEWGVVAERGNFSAPPGMQ